MSKIVGKTLGLRGGQVRALERLLHRKIDASRAVTHEFARELSALARETGRCVGVLVDRRGRVLDVAVGDAHRVALPTRRIPRAPTEGRLAGVRFVRTSLRDGEFGHDDLVALSRNRLDAIVRVEAGTGAEPSAIQTATLLPRRDGSPFEVSPRIRPTAIRDDFLETVEALEEEFARTAPDAKAAVDRDRAILVGVARGPAAPARESLAELVELARSAGIEVADTHLQRRDRPDPSTVVGSGLLEEVVRRAAALGAGLLVVDGELSPRQAHNLEHATGLEIMDRTMTILEIFGRRAVTADGKIRVELARLQYMFPHLLGRGIEMSRLGGLGGGAKGAVRGLGEQKLELDRRVLRTRIDRLKREIERIGKRRGEMRKRRREAGLPTVAIVGYANAGKSTLFNALTREAVRTEDLLFSTLETTTRRARLPGGAVACFIDTVGFLRDLPEGLRDAFRATLEEIEGADLLLHVVDASNEAFPHRMEAVERTLGEVGLGEIPRVAVFNKADRVTDRSVVAPFVERTGGILVCALEADDIRGVVERVRREFERLRPGVGAATPPALPSPAGDAAGGYNAVAAHDQETA